MKILILNGPNINMLGIREPEIYGKQNYKALLSFLGEVCEGLGVEYECYQSNHEGALVDKIQGALGVFDAIVFNPGAFTHYKAASSLIQRYRCSVFIFNFRKCLTVHKCRYSQW